MEGALLSVENVSVYYHTPQGETEAVRTLSFAVKRGEFVAVVGPSGCGKTTILSLIMGLNRPSQGRVRFPLGPCPMGYMLQRDNLLEWRTLEKNAILGLEVQHKLNEETRSKTVSLLRKYGLGDFLTYHPGQLSGGMRQKAALIRTLALDPELLLLDEPFSALDYQTRLTLADEVFSIIRQEGKTALLVTHDIGEAVSMADRVLVFSDRPATLKREILLDFPRDMTPLLRREEPVFQEYFGAIWKELER
jgi:NitT/TauT family transport system ATP-binding protein